MKKIRALYILAEGARSLVYGQEEQRAIAEWAELTAPPQTRESIARNPAPLRAVEAIFSNWGAPVLNAALLRAAPDLKAFFYEAGLIGPEAWERGLVVTSASCANAVPVAEFTLAAVIFALKGALPRFRQGPTVGKPLQPRPMVAGTYGSTVGLVSLGEIGQAVAAPVGLTRALELVSGKTAALPTGSLAVKPMSTVVLYLGHSQQVAAK